MKRLAFALFVCAATAASAHAEAWSVVDGSPHYLSNVWDMSLDLSQISASAGIVEKEGGTGASRRVTMTGVVLRGEHRLSFPASAHGPSCLFVGTLAKSNEIVGVSNCGGQSAVWRARRL